MGKFALVLSIFSVAVLLCGMLLLSAEDGRISHYDGTTAYAATGKLLYVCADGSSKTQICMADVDGSHAVRVTNQDASHWSPSWKPDGDEFAHHLSHPSTGNASIVKRTSDGANPIVLTPDGAHDIQPAWSPDGKKIVFSSKAEFGDMGIWAMNADGTDRRLLTSSRGAGSTYPCWSPDGKKICFTRIKSVRTVIWVADADGKNAAPLDMSEDVSNVHGNWSPDGEWIVYDCGQEICKIRSDSSDNQRLTSMKPLENGGPSWSGDGKRILFSSNRSGRWQLYGMKPDGTEVARILASETHDYDPAAQPGAFAPEPTATRTPLALPTSTPPPAEPRYTLSINGTQILNGQTTFVVENGVVDINPAPERDHTYSRNSGVNLSVSPAKESYGVKMGGDCAGKQKCDLTMNGNKSVEVHILDLPSLLIHDAANHNHTAYSIYKGEMGIAGGSVIFDPSPSGGNYDFDEEVKIEIPSEDHDDFTGWGLACSSATGYTCTLIMDGDKTAGVYFDDVGPHHVNPATPTVTPSPTSNPPPISTPPPDVPLDPTPMPARVTLATSSGDIALALQISPVPPPAHVKPPKSFGELLSRMNQYARSDAFQQILRTLRESKGIVPGIPDDFLFDPKRTLSYGMQSSDVWKFQRFLNLYSECRVAPLGKPGSFGMETRYYGKATEAAAKCFQETHGEEILKPLGLKEGTGIAAERTLTKVNSILKETRAKATTPPMIPINMTYRDVQFNMSGVATFHGWGSPGAVVYLHSVAGPCRESYSAQPTVAEMSCTAQVNSGGYWQIDNVPLRHGHNTFFMGSNWKHNDPCNCFSGWGPADTFIRAPLHEQLYMSLAEEVVNTQIARILSGDTKTIQEHAIRMGLDLLVIGDALDVGQQAMLIILGDDDADPVIGSLALLGIASTFTGPGGDGLVSGAKATIKTARYIEKVSPVVGKHFEEAGLQIFTSVSIRNLDEIPAKAKELKQIAELGLKLLNNQNLPSYEKILKNPEDVRRLAKYLDGGGSVKVSLIEKMGKQLEVKVESFRNSAALNQHFIAHGAATGIAWEGKQFETKQDYLGVALSIITNPKSKKVIYYNHSLTEPRIGYLF